jgi:DNA/RNA endonuclease YhcR with UshA esterase domain
MNKEKRVNTRMMAVPRRLLVTALLLPLLAACDHDPAPPFAIDGTGAIEGALFLDTDRDDRFDPAAGDMALSGIRLELRERGTTRIIGTATTDAAGRFTLANVPPGTHHLWVDTATVNRELYGDRLAFCQNPLPVTVYLREQQFRLVAAREGCLVLIRDAKLEPAGTFVMVRGVVTSRPGEFHSARTYIEDATSGIRIFSLPLGGRTVERGDTLEVAGVLGVATGELELTQAQIVAHGPGGPEPAPAQMTTGALAEVGAPPSNPVLGRLVQVRRAGFTTHWGDGITARNAVINDGSGTVEIRVEPGVFTAPGTTPEFIAALRARWPMGVCYDITGIAGTFNGTAQIFPRSQNDIQEVPCN